MSDAIIEVMVDAFMESEDRQKQEGGFDYRVSLRAALAAAEGAGWMLVPKEATPEMKGRPSAPKP